jgi:hypothetical protein
MAISPLSFNIFIHALQVSSSSAVFDCNRNIPSTLFLSSCNLVCLLKYKESNITWHFEFVNANDELIVALWCSMLPVSEMGMIPEPEDVLHIPWPQSVCKLLLQGELYVSIDGCCVCNGCA